MPTIAHFHVIHMASALTSSMVTVGWYRMPPFEGPREVLWWTRYPVYTRTDSSSWRTGTATVSTRLGFRRTSWTPGSRFRTAAASSSCDSAAPHGEVVLTPDPVRVGVRGQPFECSPGEPAGNGRPGRCARPTRTARANVLVPSCGRSPVYAVPVVPYEIELFRGFPYVAEVPRRRSGDGSSSV